jgi:hypothetical protein
MIQEIKAMINQHPTFHVRRIDTNQTLPFNEWVKVIWQKIIIDTEGGVDLALGRYTPRVEGNYFVSATAEIKNPSDDPALGRGIAIYKNGGLFESQFVLSTSKSILGHSVHIDSIIPMNGTDDFFEVAAYSDSKLFPTVEWNSWFCGFKI